jgi:hypothetical protein
MRSLWTVRVEGPTGLRRLTASQISGTRPLWEAKERFVEYWNHDPWQLNTGGDGRRLADGAAYLLPYYMGLYHGFIER